jgi:hypothetical protein
MKRGRLLGAAVVLVSTTGVGAGTIPAANAAGASGFTCTESFPAFPGNGSASCDGTAFGTGSVLGELDLLFSYYAPNPLQVSESGSYCFEADNDEEDGGGEAEGCPSAGNFQLTQVGAMAVITTTGSMNGAGLATAVLTSPIGVPGGGPATMQLTGFMAGA